MTARRPNKEHDRNEYGLGNPGFEVS